MNTGTLEVLNCGEGDIKITFNGDDPMETPGLTWQLLTKRPENFRKRLEAAYSSPGMGSGNPETDWIWHWANDAGATPENVWIGVSAEDQENFDLRMPRLAAIPAKVRFISAEPLLGPIAFSAPSHINWIIFGGESGAHARACCVEWIADGLAQCRALGIAPFVKQLGSRPEWNHIVPGCSVREKVEPLILKHKKGEDPSEWPEELRVREFP